MKLYKEPEYFPSKKDEYTRSPKINNDCNKA